MRYNYYLAKENHKENNVYFLLLWLFSIETVVGSGYYGIESPFLYMRNLKTHRFLELLSAACWSTRATGSQNGF